MEVTGRRNNLLRVLDSEESATIVGTSRRPGQTAARAQGITAYATFVHGKRGATIPFSCAWVRALAHGGLPRKQGASKLAHSKRRPWSAVACSGPYTHLGFLTGVVCLWDVFSARASATALDSPTYAEPPLHWREPDGLCTNTSPDAGRLPEPKCCGGSRAQRQSSQPNVVSVLAQTCARKHVREYP